MTKKAKKGSKRKRQKTGLNRSILDVGLGMLRSAIKYKVEEAGGVFIDVPIKKVKPSQTCPRGNHQKKKELSQRVHCCSKCGYTTDRDVAASQVCLNWALGTSVLDVDAMSSTENPTALWRLSATGCEETSKALIETPSRNGVECRVVHCIKYVVRRRVL